MSIYLFAFVYDLFDAFFFLWADLIVCVCAISSSPLKRDWAS